MSAFERGAPRGHGAVLAGLWRAAASSRLPHALLFHGPEGIGKYRAARWLAQGLFCDAGPERAADEGPCGACGPCKRTASGNHPDLFAIDPVAEALETIPIGRVAARDEDVPSAEEFFALRAMERGWRVAIVREAERAREATQNALLKSLEEPGPRCLWILESSQPRMLLDTIRSRCVAVRFEPLDPQDAGEVLRAAGLEPERAARLARWSRGSPGLALGLAARNADELRARVAAVLEGVEHPLQASSAVWQVEGDHPGRTARARDRERARAVLAVVIDVLADGLRLASGVGAEGLAHGDLVAAGPWRPAASWHGALQSALRAREDVERNLAPEAVLDAAFLALRPLAEAPPGSGSRPAGAAARERR